MSEGIQVPIDRGIYLAQQSAFWSSFLGTNFMAGCAPSQIVQACAKRHDLQAQDALL